MSATSACGGGFSGRGVYRAEPCGTRLRPALPAGDRHEHQAESAVLNKNLTSDAFQAVIVMEPAEPSTGNDAMPIHQLITPEPQRTR